MAQLSVIISTAERVLLESEHVTKITLPTTSGEITVLPDHVPLMSVLATGEINIETEEGETYYFVSGGIIQVAGNHIELLATTAEHSEDLNTAKIEEAKRRAEKLIAENPVDVDIAQIEASLKQELVKEKIIQRRHR